MLFGQWCVGNELLVAAAILTILMRVSVARQMETPFWMIVALEILRQEREDREEESRRFVDWLTSEETAFAEYAGEITDWDGNNDSE